MATQNLPIHVRFPDLRRSDEIDDVPYGSNGRSEQSFPTFESVAAVLDSSVDPQGRTTAKSNWAVGARRMHRRRRMHEDALDPTDALGDCPPVIGPSWRPVVALIVVLLAAAGMTFWITFRGAAESTAPSEPAAWDSESTAVGPDGFEFHQHLRTAKANRPFDPPIGPFFPRADEPADTAAPGIDSNGSLDTGYPDTGYPETGYPDTGYPDDWRLSPRAASSPATTDTSARTRLALQPAPSGRPPSVIVDPARAEPTTEDDKTPVVTFHGTIETPNLRAYHDRQRSNIY